LNIIVAIISMNIRLPKWKYWDYVKYASKTTLKSRYSNMYLGYVWWFLDPLLFMVIYTFVYQVVFQRELANYPVFLLIGLISWRWISGSLTQASASIYQRLGLIEQIAAPKHVFPLVNIFIETMLFIAALMIIPMAMLVLGVPFTWHVVEVIPIALVTIFALYGLGMIFAHIGTYVADFKQILSYMLRLTFYLSPIFYDLSDLAPNMREIMWMNPATAVVQGFRDAILYGNSPSYTGMLYVLMIGLVTIPIGYSLLKKYDRTYAKIK